MGEFESPSVDVENYTQVLWAISPAPDYSHYKSFMYLKSSTSLYYIQLKTLYIIQSITNIETNT